MGEVNIRVDDGFDGGEQIDVIEMMRLLASWAVQAHRRCNGEAPVGHAREPGALCAPAAEFVAEEPLDVPAPSAKVSLSDERPPDCIQTEAP